MSKTLRIPVDQVEYNPFRDIQNYPIDKDSVARLEESIAELGNFRTMAARRNGTGYQIAEGHHRLEAIKALLADDVLIPGMEDGKLGLSVNDYDDDQMVEIMTVENSTQRGHNAAALLDSVAAITRQLAYVMLTHDPDDLSTIVERCFETKKSAEVAKGQLLKGNGIGEPAIRAFAPQGSLHLREVREAIATLKADGRLNAIIESVKQRIDDELAEAEAAEEAARTAKAKAKAKAETDKKRKNSDSASKAASSKHKDTLGSGIAKYFSNSNQLSAFRKVCEANADILPIEQHEAIAKELKEDMGDDISGVAIKNWVNDKAHDIRVKQRANSKAEKAEAERMKNQNSLEGHMETIQRGVNMIMSAVANANALIRRHKDLDPPRGAAQLKRGIKKLINELEKLEGAL